jgi:predicted tellurium resistance membrane protein TerC
LAFSLDSVTAAIAVADRTWLIIAGGTMGVIALRFLAGLFLQWLQVYPRLEEAGYITVACVGVRLLFEAVIPMVTIPQWLMIAVIGVVFLWGFSERTADSLRKQS